MKALLPHPLVSAGLFLMWLLLEQRLAPGPALVGAVVALMGGWALAMLRPGRTHLRRLGTILRLAGHVAVDVARSNIGVAQVIHAGHLVAGKSGATRNDITGIPGSDRGDDLSDWAVVDDQLADPPSGDPVDLDGSPLGLDRRAERDRLACSEPTEFMLLSIRDADQPTRDCDMGRLAGTDLERGSQHADQRPVGFDAKGMGGVMRDVEKSGAAQQGQAALVRAGGEGDRRTGRKPGVAAVAQRDHLKLSGRRKGLRRHPDAEVRSGRPGDAGGDPDGDRHARPDPEWAGPC